MTLYQTQLVAYAAGAVIHGTLAVLVLRLYRHTTGEDRSEVFKRIAVCLAGFFWQFGNFWDVSGVLYSVAGDVMWYSALVTFPLLLGHSLNEPVAGSRVSTILTAFVRFMRYPQWVFTPVAILSGFLAVSGLSPLVEPDLAVRITLNLLLFYILVFVTLGILRRRLLRASGDRIGIRANRLILYLMPVTAILCVAILYYPGALRANAGWLVLAAGMMSIPSTIGTAYRLYRFPFMDVFLRETMTGIVLLTAFCAGYSVAPPSDWMPLWVAALAMSLAAMRAPLSRWVERRFLGYEETAEQQEERIGDAIRNLTLLERFDDEAARVVGDELEATRATISSEPADDAGASFPIADSPQRWLSLGPRRNGRSYMSRHLRLARSAALQIAAHRQRLRREETERRSLIEQHELRELTARAQIRALQAQINPHFLFNTLNTLAALIDSNPGRAERITEDLADVFRYALDSTTRDRVPLSEEIKFLEAYLAIEKARFDSRLSYSFDVTPEAAMLSVPPMLLQPLVENAVRHGIGQKLEGGTVRVIACASANRLMVTVEDTGVGFVRERPGGIGLTNVRERLMHVYGDAGRLEIARMEPEGTRMTITAPR